MSFPRKSRLTNYYAAYESLTVNCAVAQRHESYPRFLLRFGVKNAVWFGDYCRFVEVRLITQALAARKIHSLLDIGCAGTLFPYYIAHLLPTAHVVGIDSGENLRFAPAEMMRAAARLGTADRVHLLAADARKLPLGAQSFDAATAISMLEHIHDDGDTKAVTETMRLLRPGGLFAFSVPMAERHAEHPSTSWCPYFVRQYDRQTLAQRLIEPAKPRSVIVRYFRERHVPYSNYYLRLRSTQERWCAKGLAWKPLRYLVWAALLLTPLASRLFMQVWRADSTSKDSRVPGGAAVIMEKP